MTVYVADTELGDDCIHVLFERVGKPGRSGSPIHIRFQPLLGGTPLYDRAESVLFDGWTQTCLCKVPVSGLYLSQEIRLHVEAARAAELESGDPLLRLADPYGRQASPSPSISSTSKSGLK